jgi:hypothetical protein
MEIYDDEVEKTTKATQIMYDRGLEFGDGHRPRHAPFWKRVRSHCSEVCVGHYLGLPFYCWLADYVPKRPDVGDNLEVKWTATSFAGGQLYVPDYDEWEVDAGRDFMLVKGGPTMFYLWGWATAKTFRKHGYWLPAPKGNRVLVLPHAHLTDAADYPALVGHR